MAAAAAKTDTTSIATANAPSAAIRCFSSSRSSVLAKREPMTAPSPTITALTTHHGIDGMD